MIYFLIFNFLLLLCINRTTLKEPKKPGLAFVIVQSLLTPSLLLGLFLEALAIATQILQPFIMKELLKVVMKKGIYEAAQEMFPTLSDSDLAQMGIEMPDFPYGWAITIILCPFLVCYLPIIFFNFNVYVFQIARIL
jgi:hypothetical protein